MSVVTNLIAPFRNRSAGRRAARIGGVAAGVFAFLLSAATAHAQISFVQVAGTATSKGVSAGSLTTTLQSGVSVTAGDFVVVAFALRTSSSNQASSCTDSQGNTYTVEIKQTNGASGTSFSMSGVCTSPIATGLGAGDTITVSWPTAVSGAFAMSVLEFSGVATSGALDKQQSNFSSSQNTSASSGATRSTGQGNELILGTVGVPGCQIDGFTAGTGFTLQGQVGTGQTGPTCIGGDVTINPMYQIVSSTGTYTATGTLGVSHSWSAAITTYRDANVPQAGGTESFSFGSPENSYISVPDSAGLKPTSLTIEAWIKPASFAASSYYPIVMKTSVAYPSAGYWGDGYALELETDGSANAKLVFWVNNVSGTGGIRVPSTATISAGVWTHVAATFDGTSLGTNVYVNGAPNAISGTSSAAINYVGTPPLQIGRGYGGREFNGEIDEVRIWNIVRTQSQLQNYAHMTSLPPAAALAAYWMADDGPASTMVTDSSGTSADGVTTTGSISAGSATLTPASEAGFANGDNIYIVLDNNTVFATTISSGVGTGTWTLSANAPSAATSGAVGHANNGTVTVTGCGNSNCSLGSTDTQATWNTSTAPLGWSGQTTTTGTITGGTNSLTLAAAIDFANGDTIYVNQDDNTVFTTTISSGGGTTTLTLAANAPANSTGLVVGHANGAWVETNNATNAGPGGATIQDTISSPSPPDDSDNNGMYQYGSASGSALSAGESFPSGIVSRSNTVWGIVTRVPNGSTVSAGLYIDYSGIVYAEPVTLLSRADANTMTWTAVDATTYTLDSSNHNITFNSQNNPASEYALGFQSNVTAVTLVSFNATQYDRGALLQWKTGYEVNNLGFNVYRDVNGTRTKLNGSLIAGSGLTVGRGTPVTSVHSYATWDLGWTMTVASSMPAVYWLEDVDFNGTSTLHGPVTPVSGGDLAPTVASSDALTGLGTTGGSGTTAGTNASRTSVTRGEPLARRWGPGEGPKAGRALDHHEAAPLSLGGTPAQTQWELAARPGVKIGVRAAGWYRVSQPDLVAAGLDPNVDPHQLRLFADGVEQAFMVTGENRGRFGPRDAIEFYGTGVDTPYTDTHVYWLVTDAGQGRRVAWHDSRAAGSTAGTAVDTTASSFWTTRQRKDRSIYFAALENGDADNWFGPVISSQSTDFTLELDNLAVTTPGAAELEVALQGVTTMAGHQVQLLVNGTAVGTMTFDGQSEGVSSVSVPQSLLSEGTNTVTLVALGGDSDISLVDTIHLGYWHTYRADADRLWATVNGQQGVTLGGFSSSAIRVVDITDPAAPVEVRGATAAEQGGTWAMRLHAPGTGPRTLFAFTSGTVGTAATLQQHRPTTWHEATNAADYVVVAHESFLQSLGPLTALRKREGHTVAVVNVDDAYAEYSFGEKAPLAIKTLLQTAWTTWSTPPKFVVLVGDATIDPRDYAGLGPADFVPTKDVPMTTVALKTASDDWMVDFSNRGLPDIPIGRLSVRTPAQAQAMVAKIVGYAQAPVQDWTKDVLLVADTNDSVSNFEARSLALRALLPSGYRPHDVFRGRLGDDAARGALLADVNQGQVLVDYQGHGSVQLWSEAPLLTNDDVYGLWTNAGRLPFVIAMDCLNGLFNQIWDEESLAEALTRAPQGGAVAVWASSSLTTPRAQTPINQALVRLLFQGKFATLGESVVAAKLAGTNTDLIRTLIFFGDPATRLLGAPLPAATPAATSTPVGTVVLITNAPSASAAGGRQSSDPSSQADGGAFAAAERSAGRLADLSGRGATPFLYAPESGQWAAEVFEHSATKEYRGLVQANLQLVPADLDGSKTDLVVYDPVTGVWRWGLGPGGANGAGVAGGQVYVGDFTGAGYDTVLTYSATTGAWVLEGLAGKELAGEVRRISSGTWPAGARLNAGDLTGVGRDDIVGYDPTTGHGFIAVHRAGGQFDLTPTGWGSGWQIAIGNLGGAGRTARGDLLLYQAATGTWMVNLRDGRGGFTASQGVWPAGMVVQLNDLNGDGRDDVVGYNPASGNWLTAEVDGPGSFAVEQGTWQAGLLVATGDLRAEGHADIVLYDPVTGVAFELFPLAPGRFEVQPQTWMPDGILVSRP